MRHALIATVMVLSIGCSDGSATQPNILLITLDTTRADYLSTYGFEGGKTPNFDGLADAGIRFDQAISASGVTPVSHASILTGLFPYRHGLRVLSAASGFRLPEHAPTLTTWLKEAGYSTGAVLSAFPVSDYFGFERDFDLFEGPGGSMKSEKSWDVRGLQRRSDETTDLALEFTRDADKPFFLWIHYWDPHDPFLKPPDKFVEGVPRKWPNDAWYAAEVRYVDAQFGRLVRGLKRQGVWRDTLVAVTADHGEGLSDGKERHGWHGHRMVYQEQVRVPLILRIPRGERGVTVPDLVRTVDIVPTLLDYAGLEVLDNLDGLDGRSLRDLVEGTPGPRRVAYADQINGYDLNATMIEDHPEAAFLYCLIDRNWKLTYRPHMREKSELYDLDDDPEERTNLFKMRPEIVRRLLTDLAKRRPWVLEPFVADGTQDPAAMEALTALGYAPADGTDTDQEWSWTCPIHPDAREPTPGMHADCGGRLVPIAN